MALTWQGVEWGASLPRVVLLHGTADTCALFNNATQFRDALREVGAKVRCKFLAESLYHSLGSGMGEVSSDCSVSGAGVKRFAVMIKAFCREVGQVHHWVATGLTATRSMLAVAMRLH